METEIDTLLNKKVQIIQFKDSVKASIDAILLSSIIDNYTANNISTVLDIGSGAGGISLCLAYKFPTLNITAIDIQKELIDLLNKSINLNNFKNINTVVDNILKPTSPIKKEVFDFVITNPPFYKGTVSKDNIKATAHNEQINLNDWITSSIKRLKVQGLFAIIHKTERIDDIIFSLKSNNMGRIEIFPILSKKTTNSKRIIVLSKKHSKSHSILHKPIIIHNNDGSYTNQAIQILENGQSIKDILDLIKKKLN